MKSILTIMGGTLGILVPLLFMYAIKAGISTSVLSVEKKHNYKIISNSLIVVWTILIWTLSINGTLSYHEGDTFPRFLVPLFLPVIIGVIFLFDRQFFTIINNIPLNVLVGLQAFRLAGFAFLIIANIGILPPAFSIGGYGDILTGIFAILAARAIIKSEKKSRVLFWLFNIVGLTDLLNVAFLMLYYYPIWSQSDITSVAVFDFSLIMIPAIAAPIALILHFYAIRNYYLQTKK